MDDAKSSEHRRRVLALGTIGEPPTSDDARRVLDQVRELVGDHGDVDVSAWELASLLGAPDADAVGQVLGELFASGHLRMIGPSPRMPGIAPTYYSCGECGAWIESVHKRALELMVKTHMREVHGDVVPRVDFTTPTDRGKIH